LPECDAPLERGDRVLEVPVGESYATERTQRLHDREWVVGCLRDPDRVPRMLHCLDESTEKQLNAAWVERDALLAQSDFVVVMAPYSAATHHLIGAAEIAKMKPTAILVNSARGGVVDDAALVQALKEKRIAGAGLDVFEGEPKLHPGYATLPNVVLTPHIGSASRATRIVMCNTAAANMTAVLEGRDPQNPVN